MYLVYHIQSVLSSPNAMIKPIPQNQQKSPHYKDNFLFSFSIIGANFSEARVRRNSSPQPPPSAAPERFAGAKRRRQISSAIFQEMISSRTVKIHQNLTFCNNANFFRGRAKRVPLISPRQILSARRGEPRLAVGQDEVRLLCDFNSVSDLLCPIIL